MCTSKTEGGKRCEYADMLANERRKLRWKHRDAWDKARKVEDGMRTWKEEHKELVREHLPEKQPFQVEPNKKPIPQDLLTLLTPKGQPVKGLPTAERLKMTFQMAVDYENWEEKLPLTETNAVKDYTLTGFEGVNSFLRKKGFTEWKAKNRFRAREDEDSLEERLQKKVNSMDIAFKKSGIKDAPQKLYRFFRVPAGVNPTEFVQKYFTEGSAYQDKGYLSTSADIEFILAHLHNRNGGTRNKGYVIMEVLTKQGQSVQAKDTPSPGDVQSLENEALIPRGAKFRVAGSRARQKFEFGGDRQDLDRHYNGATAGYAWKHDDGTFKKGMQMSFPVVQLVDEELIRPTKRTHEAIEGAAQPFTPNPDSEKAMKAKSRARRGIVQEGGERQLDPAQLPDYIKKLLDRE